MIKKKKIPIKSLVLILILVELICLVFAGILGEPGNDINLKTASWICLLYTSPSPRDS